MVAFKKIIFFYYKKIIRRKKSIDTEIKLLRSLQTYLLGRYGYLVTKYASIDKPEINSGSYKVWIMWWQGEEDMPEIIRLNYDSVKLNRNGNDVILITSENFQQYVNIPDYILAKLRVDALSITHLSDIIRVSILAAHGGLWLDASVYVNERLPKKFDYSYWTTKWILSPHEYSLYRLWIGLWSLSSVPKLTITQCMGVWYSSANNPIFLCLRDFWFSYMKQEDKVHYYWLTELFLIGCMYDRISSVKSQIDEVPLSNSNIFKIRDHINCSFDATLFSQMTSDTFLFYLSWKAEYRETENGSSKKTLYYKLRFDNQNSAD